MSTVVIAPGKQKFTRVRIPLSKLPLPPAPERRYVTREELAAIFRISLSSIKLIIKSGNGPKEIVFGPGLIRYDLQEIPAWLETMTKTPTAPANGRGDSEGGHCTCQS
jgi:predicted DNA-binding transcriptional regulator AlpA